MSLTGTQFMLHACICSPSHSVHTLKHESSNPIHPSQPKPPSKARRPNRRPLFSYTNSENRHVDRVHDVCPTLAKIQAMARRCGFGATRGVPAGDVYWAVGPCTGAPNSPQNSEVVNQAVQSSVSECRESAQRRQPTVTNSKIECTQLLSERRRR